LRKNTRPYRFHDEAVEILFLSAKIGDQGVEPFIEIPDPTMLHVLACTRDRFLDSFAIERLEQVVECVDIETPGVRTDHMP
jgi:hypothetical protein